MRRRWLRASAVLGAALFGCAHPKPEPKSIDSTLDHPGTGACARIDPKKGDAAFERAGPFLAQLGHEDFPPKDVFERGLADLEEAAENGNLEGQVAFGNTSFGFSYTDHAPVPADRETYVRALRWLRVAALRGQRRVIESYPGIDAPKLAAKKRLESPLGDVPRSWLERAFLEADAWLRCAPEAAKTRWLAPPAAKPKTALTSSDSGWTEPRDKEGPLLRVTYRESDPADADPSLTTRLLSALPDVFDCWRARLEGGSSEGVELAVKVTLGPTHATVDGGDDERLHLCVRQAFERLELPRAGALSLSLGLGLYPRAALAPALPETSDPNDVQRWKEDGSCWGYPVMPPCPPNKVCEKPTRERVRCP